MGVGGGDGEGDGVFLGWRERRGGGERNGGTPSSTTEVTWQETEQHSTTSAKVTACITAKTKHT